MYASVYLIALIFLALYGSYDCAFEQFCLYNVYT